MIDEVSLSTFPGNATLKFQKGMRHQRRDPRINFQVAVLGWFQGPGTTYHPTAPLPQSNSLTAHLPCTETQSLSDDAADAVPRKIGS